jgi:hypothetical protein
MSVLPYHQPSSSCTHHFPQEHPPLARLQKVVNLVRPLKNAPGFELILPPTGTKMEELHALAYGNNRLNMIKQFQQPVRQENTHGGKS